MTRRGYLPPGEQHHGRHAEPLGGLFAPPVDVPTLDDARQARDAGMEQAQQGLDVWTTYATDWLHDYLAAHPTMFTDDLWGEGLRQPPPGADGKPRMRALGPIVSGFARRKFIIKSGTYRPRKFGHAAEGPVWRSLIYNPKEQI